MDNRMDDHDALKYCNKDLYAKDRWEFWLVDAVTVILLVTVIVLASITFLFGQNIWNNGYTIGDFQWNYPFLIVPFSIAFIILTVSS